jgi:hypothetical protein
MCRTALLADRRDKVSDHLEYTICSLASFSKQEYEEASRKLCACSPFDMSRSRTKAAPAIATAAPPMFPCSSEVSWHWNGEHIEIEWDRKGNMGSVGHGERTKHP